MESGLFLIATVALALVLWIHAIRLLRQIYRKSREDLGRITRREAAPPLRTEGLPMDALQINTGAGGNPWWVRHQQKT